MMALKLISRTAFGTRRAADTQQSDKDTKPLDSSVSETDLPSTSSASKVSTPITPPDQLTDDGADGADGANDTANGQTTTADGHRFPPPKKRSLRKGAKRESMTVESAKKKAAAKRRKSMRIARIKDERESGGSPKRGGDSQEGPRPARLKLNLNLGGASGLGEGEKGKAAK
jgi:hypothetical protein